MLAGMPDLVRLDLEHPDYDELKAEYEAKEAAMGLESEYTFDHYLERMMSRGQELSTAELIQCVDASVRKLKNRPDVVKTIYGGDERDYISMVLYAHFSNLERTILKAVANLYLQRLVYLEMAYGGDAY